MIILDTNVLSELMRSQPSANVIAWIDAHARAELFTTTICEAEIFLGIELLPKGARRTFLSSAAETIFSRDLSERVLPFDSAAARNYSKIMAHCRAVGRPIGHADTQIAAIAQTRKARLATRNVVDFAACGLQLINPWKA